MIDAVREAADRIRGRVLRTPLRRSAWLSELSGGDVFLKLESLQPTFSFKIRGATNAVLRLIESGDERPLVTASAGNHGYALATAARTAGRPLTVFIAAAAPRTKIEAIQRTGAVLSKCRNYDDAEAAARAYAREKDAVYISPYAHEDVIAGAGTIALEILADDPAVDTIVAAVGGGGLVSGLALAAPSAAVIGVEIAASTPFAQSLAAGRIVTVDVGDTIADALPGNLDPDTPTFDYVRRHVRQMIVVTEEETRLAVKNAFLHERLVIEGGAGVALAGIESGRIDVKGQRVAVVVSGANVDVETWGMVLRCA